MMVENRNTIFSIIALIIGATGLGLGAFSVVSLQIYEGEQGPPGADGTDGIDGTFNSTTEKLNSHLADNNQIELEDVKTFANALENLWNIANMLWFSFLPASSSPTPESERTFENHSR